MKKVTIGDIEPGGWTGNSSRRAVSEILGTSNVAINYYRLGPSEAFPGGLHAHMDQEEVFVILEGEATFETMDGDVTVEEGEVLRVPPGEFQSGKNESNQETVAIALGAPRDTTDIRIPAECPTCDDANLRLETTDTGTAFFCPACKSEFIPRDCPECGHAELTLTRRESRTVTLCEECDAIFENPPLRA